MAPNIKLSIRFKTTAEGGRSEPVAPMIVPFYACPLGIHGQWFDCRILLTETLELGESYFVDAALLTPSLALPHMKVGDLVKLWEGKVVAEGFVEELYQLRTARPVDIDSRTIAWILYAVDLAAGKAPASLTDISSAADAINHAVPTHQEMSLSLHWLRAHGLVESRGKFHSLTELGHGLIEQARGKQPTVTSVWSRLATSIQGMSAGA